MASTTTQAPRLGTVELRGLTPAEGEELLAGDALEARDLGDVDIVGRSLADLDLEECAMGTLAASDADLRGLRLRECTIERLDAPVFRAPRSSWRGVRVASGRIGSAELYDSRFDDVRFHGMKLGFVNLRSSVLDDVLFEDSVIDELDLGGARLTRVSFVRCEIREITAGGATLKHVDLRGAELRSISDVAQLRGATVDGDQIAQLAPLLARAAGLVIED
jgi:uncharacterized protein YjbI with pentapeptide repeats